MVVAGAAAGAAAASSAAAAAVAAPAPLPPAAPTPTTPTAPPPHPRPKPPEPRPRSPPQISEDSRVREQEPGRDQRRGLQDQKVHPEGRHRRRGGPQGPQHRPGALQQRAQRVEQRAAQHRAQEHVDDVEEEVDVADPPVEGRQRRRPPFRQGEPVQQLWKHDAVPQGQQQRGQDRRQRPHERRAAQRARPDPEPVDPAQEQRDLRGAPQEKADRHEEQQGDGGEDREAPEVPFRPRHP